MRGVSPGKNVYIFFFLGVGNAYILILMKGVYEIKGVCRLQVKSICKKRSMEYNMQGNM